MHKTFILTSLILANLAATDAAMSQDAAKQTLDQGGLVLPEFDAAKGRMLFASKGCVVCHSINGIGGTDAPELSASTMTLPMDPFDFAAKMWKGAPAMIAMQEDEMGGQILFSGAELADIIAFAHSPSEQAKFSEADIPPMIRMHMDMGGMGDMGKNGMPGMMGTKPKN